MKKLYQAPLCEVIEIELENILCGSDIYGYDDNDQLLDLYDDIL